ncbi:hypothetical protein RN04_07325 [Arthrobacter sp. W1]|nr:hypothetical protein RN04_07325 [Arthrobacter sp. W1]
MTELITVGDLSRPADELRAYATTYLQTPGEFAYPAYDGYKGSIGGGIEECDLLAIALLNAGSKPITTFYTLKGLLTPINERLADPRLSGTLTDAGQPQIDAIADLFSVLDEYRTPQVNLTKLAKVVHRKNPELIPLFDRQVRRLYQGRVPRDNKRSYRNFSLAWLPEVQADLQRHHEFWLEITQLADVKVPITPLRALDIIAWHLGGQLK